MSKLEIQTLVKEHNKLRDIIDQKSGDERALLMQFADMIQRDLVRASNLVDAGKDAEHVILRIREKFEQLGINI